MLECQGLDFGSYFDGTQWITDIGIEADRPDYVTPEVLGLTFAIPSFVGFKGEIFVVTALYGNMVTLSTRSSMVRSNP